MSFKTWRTHTNVFDYLPTGYHAMANLVAQAAYKAGERKGRKDAEAIAKNAIELREQLRSNV